MTGFKREWRLSRRMRVSGALTVAGVLVGIAVALIRIPAGTRVVIAAPDAPASAAAPVAAPVPSAWATLTPAEQSTLKPLRARWETLDSRAKTHWVQVADRLQGEPSLAVARAARRMEAWQQLSKAERARARRHFVMASRLSRAERRRRWETYQASLHRPQTIDRSPQASASALAAAASAGEEPAPLAPGLNPDSLSSHGAVSVHVASPASASPAPKGDAG